MDRENRDRKIEEHLAAIRSLEAEAASEDEPRHWPPSGFYLLWHLVIGTMIGGVGAVVSLIANVLGAPIFGQRSLELIRVYLTFPMGERALALEDGALLTIGCALYLVTGALYGILIHLVLTVYFTDASPGRRFMVATAIGLGLWIVNFYLILSWLQPMLLGGNWIVRLVPPWVGALTHLAFAWTVALIENQGWGRFVAYKGASSGVSSSLFLILSLSLTACGGTGDSLSGGQNGEDQNDESPNVAASELPESGVATAALEKALEYPKWETVAPGENAGYNQRANLVQRGHLVYRKYCVGCHGETGAGDGPAAVRLITQPRDFTSGIYKFRSTGSGSLPLEADLDRTITRGLARVSMPAFPMMPETEKLAVIEYIKTFYTQWEEEKSARRVIPVPRAPEDLLSDERRWRGRMVYLQMGCGKCHGVDGRGTGATQTEYVDAWGDPQKPFDFTRGALKGGNAPEDIYRTFHTGLRSIMPSFGGDTLAAVTADGYDAVAGALQPGETERLAAVRDAFPADGAAVFSVMSESERLELAERNSWDLVAYILSLRSSTTTAAAVLGAAG